MKVLVIPDIHLKLKVFELADELMQSGEYDKAIFLGDFCDDWNQQNNVGLYEKTLDALDLFLEKYPDSLVCWGNHDLAYIWGIEDHPGFSTIGEPIIRGKLNALDRKYPDTFRYMHKIDNVLFSHAGVTNSFAERHLSIEDTSDISSAAHNINSLGKDIMWEYDSPIWARPDYDDFLSNIMQVVGHSPVHNPIAYRPKLILCDTFSTFSDGREYGSNVFIAVDTEAQNWEVINGNN